MAKKKGRPAWFKMFLHQKALIDAVPDETAGKSLKAVFQYFDTGELPELDPMAFAVFATIKPYVDESFEDFERTSEKNRENVQKRWNKEKSDATTGTIGNDVLPSDTTDAEAEEKQKQKRKQITEANREEGLMEKETRDNGLTSQPDNESSHDSSEEMTCPEYLGFEERRRRNIELLRKSV